MDELTIQEEAFKRGYEKGRSDAMEVVHGHWEDEYDGAFENPRYRCSVCKEKALYRHEQDCLGGWHEVQALTPICPYCGAMLDGGNEDA